MDCVLRNGWTILPNVKVLFQIGHLRRQRREARCRRDHPDQRMNRAEAERIAKGHVGEPTAAGLKVVPADFPRDLR